MEWNFYQSLKKTNKKEGFFIIEYATCGIFMQSKPSCKDEETAFFYYYLNLNLVLGTLMRNPTKKKLL